MFGAMVEEDGLDVGVMVEEEGRNSKFISTKSRQGNSVRMHRSAGRVLTQAGLAGKQEAARRRWKEKRPGRVV